ncbi:MAG: DUF2842 domain-containing protein [Pseudomonadota bacterium]
MWIEVAYYVVAGLLWVLPAGVVVWWMQKSDEPDTQQPG